MDLPLHSLPGPSHPVFSHGRENAVPYAQSGQGLQLLSPEKGEQVARY
jgi:hypothetical protein